MIDINELRRLVQAVSEWSNCNQAWHDASEDVLAAVVGHIDEDGNTYPVATIDCDQYYAAHQSLPLAKFYAAANPAAVSELLDRLEAAEKAVTEAYQRGYATGQEESEKERDALRAKIEATEKQEPVAWVNTANLESAKIERERGGQGDTHTWAERPTAYHTEALYARPIPPAPSVPNGFVWPECPKRRQSHVLFDDGYEEGWAACISTVKAMLASAQKPEGE